MPTSAEERLLNGMLPTYCLYTKVVETSAGA